MPFVDLVADAFAAAVGNVNVGRVRLGGVNCAGVVNGVLTGGELLGVDCVLAGTVCPFDEHIPAIIPQVDPSGQPTP
jgi:hypothetical protein